VFGGTIEVEFQDVNNTAQLEHLGLAVGKGCLVTAPPAVARRRFHAPGREGITGVHLVESIQVKVPGKKVKAVGDHGVYIEDVGFIFFGEALITPVMQRVSLMRFEFGCNCQGGGTAGTLGKNGGG
jgi:hypothetical protein